MPSDAEWSARLEEEHSRGCLWRFVAVTLAGIILGITVAYHLLRSR